MVAVAEDLVHRDHLAHQALDLGEHVLARHLDVEHPRDRLRRADQPALPRETPSPATSGRCRGSRAAAASRRSARSRRSPRRTRPSSWWRLICSRLKSSSMPGGTVSSSAAMSITPRSASSAPSQRWTAPQLASISRSACTSWPQSRSPTGVGSGPSAVSSESERLCAGSVETIDRAQPGGGAAARGGGGDAGLADAALAGVEDGPRGGSRRVRRHPERRSGYFATLARAFQSTRGASSL